MVKYCCEDSIQVGDQECEWILDYYDLNILWLYTITVCVYQCPNFRITTQRWRRFLFWCKRLS
jgi:hypothetical protein